MAMNIGFCRPVQAPAAPTFPGSQETNQPESQETNQPESQVPVVSRDATSLRMEERRRKWLAERGLTPPAPASVNAQATSNNANSWVVPDSAPPGKVVHCADGASGTAPGFKVMNFDRPISKPSQNDVVLPWKSTVKKGALRRVADISEVMSVASSKESKDGHATEPKSVKDLHAFWGKKDKKAKARAGKAKKLDSTHNLSKIEAQATLQRHFTSGSRIDWDEVRKLRKIIAEAE
jgi:hypothetical protein